MVECWENEDLRDHFRLHIIKIAYPIGLKNGLIASCLYILGGKRVRKTI